MLGQVAEAAPLWREILDLRPRVSGSRHYMVADSQVQYGDCLRRLGQLEEAGAWIEKGIALQRELSPASARLGWLLQFQGRWFEAAKRSEDAERAYREALLLLDRTHGAENPYFPAEARVNLGRFLRATGRDAEGRALLQRALAVRSAQLADDDPLAETVRNALR